MATRWSFILTVSKKGGQANPLQRRQGKAVRRHKTRLWVLAAGVRQDADMNAALSGQRVGELAEGAGDGLNKAGIPKIEVDEILKTPKYSRPDPATYLEKKYISNHKTQFRNGVTKISYQAPKGYAGPPGGTFVMPTSIADDLIARARGDISELERLLGLDPGELGTNPVRIDIVNPSGLRMPSGNEKGANSKWIPGGYTSGGIPEIIIDSPGPGQYTIRPIKQFEEIDNGE